MRHANAEHLLDYRNVWPDVELSVEILEAGAVNVTDMTFPASVRITLDWEEISLRENLHYHFDLRTQKPHLSSWLLNSEDRFDPEVFVANAVECETQQVTPVSIFRTVRRPVEEEGREIQETLWLTKEYVFTGLFKCMKLDARRFPFDMHRLPLQIVARPLSGGLSALGEARKVRLVDPRLRIYERILQNNASEAASPATAALTEKELRARKVAINAAKPMSALQPHTFDSKDLRQQPPHLWGRMIESASNSDPEVDTVVGDFIAVAFGGRQALPADDSYKLEMLYVRDYSAYMSDFWLKFLLTVICLLAVFVPYTDDILANRLSITLGIVLTLVSFATARAAAVESLCYDTYFDMIAKGYFAITVVVACQNLVATTLCWGTFRYGMSGANYWPDGAGATICSKSFCGGGLNHLDCIFLVIVLNLILLVPIGMWIGSILMQLRMLLHAKRAYLTTPSVRQGWVSVKAPQTCHLMLSKKRRIPGRRKPTVQFETTFSDADVAAALATVTPLLGLVPSFWAWLGRLTQTSQNRSASVPAAVPARVAPAPDEALDSPEWMERYLGVLPPVEAGVQCNLVDIGTGEMGLYKICSRMVADKGQVLFMEGKKVPMSPGNTFVEEFVKDPGGASRLAKTFFDWYLHSDEGQGPARSDSANKRKKVQFIMGTTGKIREIMIGSADSTRQMEAFLTRVETELEEEYEVAARLVWFVPPGEDEATFELTAAEWLIQIGDLDVTRVDAGPNNQFFGGFELNQAFARSRCSHAGCASASDVVQVEDFMREFADLLGPDLSSSFLHSKFEQASRNSTCSDAMSAEFGPLYQVFRDSPKLMRTLVQKRLFAGTISAGGGSSQVAIKDEPRMVSDMHKHMRSMLSHESLGEPSKPSRGLLRASEVMSLPLGNRAPLLAQEKGAAPLWSSDQPITQGMIDCWRSRIDEAWNKMAENDELPDRVASGLRGLLVGISAVFHASKLAGCAETILPRTLFLNRILRKLDDLVADPPEPKNGAYDHRDAANLTLVHEVVSRALAPTAWIVCKRNWHAQPAFLEGSDGSLVLEKEDLPEYVATWVLGFYLNQTKML
eukprot:TRINITY_DN29859_c0_g1_i1.p1 TRINITY_DN29859_c0_g1~~TRINITY_DN29859_c0_g1_i1.p1  ORF type:complete len:1145 (-),score=189.64 TRINITY_DN29859_c0_g1_i1:77-3298(-)